MLSVLRSERLRSRLIAVLVCGLAAGVFALASEAKCSQYSAGSRSEGYLAKATKMSGEGCQTLDAVAPRVVPQWHPDDVTTYVPAPPAQPLPLRAVFLHSFRFRPPPAA